jgi:hypothetical protein
MMKRITVTLLALTVVGVLSAQGGPPPKDWGVTITGFGRGAFSPIQYVGDTKSADGTVVAASTTVPGGGWYTGIGATWGFQYVRLGLTVNVGSELIGVNADVLLDKTTISTGDNAYGYAKPFSFMTLKFGKYADAVLGGKIGSNDYNLFTLKEQNEDNIFTRFLSSENTQGNVQYSTTFKGAMSAADSNVDRAAGEIGQKGFLMLLTPVKRLTLGLNLPSMGQVVSSFWTPGFGNPQSSAEYVWGNAQIAAGYDIEGVGLVRAQYVGVKDGDSNNLWKTSDYTATTGTPYSRIEAAFALSAIKGLTLDLGLKYYLPADSDEVYTFRGAKRSKYEKGMIIGLGGRFAGGGFAKGAYAIEGRVDAALPSAFKNQAPASSATLDTETGFNLNVHLTPSYNLGPCTLGVEFGLESMSDGKSGSADVKDGYTRVGLGLWAQKGLGTAKFIKAGLGVMLPYTGNDKVEHGMILSIPIVFQYVFF